jgi:ABC-2 type transport system permease protein
VFNPLHYQELPELFMDFVSSLTGKSPSTTGAGSEGALTKGPFNAVRATADLNNALIGMILQMQATLLTASAIVRERERGTIEQLIVTPIRPWELIVGKILPFALVALLITIEVLIIGTFWFQVPIRGSLILLLSISCLFLLSCLGIGLLISTIAQTQQEAFLLTFLTLLPSIFLSGFIYPIAAMPVALQFVSNFIPLTYFLVVVRGIVLKGVGIPDLMNQIIALFIFGIILIVLASARFRKRLD